MRVCPDFVIELMSDNDTFSEADKKMENWIGNGVRLGWLIIPQERMSWIYQSTAKPESCPFEIPLSGRNVLSGFELDLRVIFGE